MADHQRWATLAARLESFEAVIPLPKRRGSQPKGSKSIKWPHQRPSPMELAQAGFYYNPLPSSPDNTVCFLCESSLDGWEEDDDPMAEHLKHSSQCGWAITMAVGRQGFDPSSMEDPTDTKLSDARRATFMSSWPHEGKRGWSCKTDKLVDAGWHFAPTPESEDFVSCAYCKLALDGWEPKDQPFDEHYRRSPDCPFFSFAGTTATKSTRGKKGRPSKSSRNSVQSVLPVASDAPSIPDVDESIDVSTLSHDTVLSTSSKMGSKKTAKGRGKATRTRKMEAVEVTAPDMAVDGDEQQDDPKLTKLTGGRKRTSDQISEDDCGTRESTAKPEPPSKKRITRKKSSMNQEVFYPGLQPEPEAVEMGPISTKLTRAGGEHTSSRTREFSTASNAAVGAVMPDSASIEAALEEDLNKPMSDEDMEPSSAKEPAGLNGQRNRGATTPANSSKPARGDNESSKGQQIEELVMAPERSCEPDTEASAPPKLGARTTRITKKPVAKRTARAVRGSVESTAAFATTAETQLDSSMLTAPKVEDDSGHGTDASLADRPLIQKDSKRTAANKPRTKRSSKRIVSKNIEDILQSQPESQAASTEPELEGVKTDDMEKIATGQVERGSELVEAAIMAVEKAPKKTTKSSKNKTGKRAKGDKTPDKPPHLSIPGAFSPLMPDRSPLMPDKDPEPLFSSLLLPTSPPIITKKSGDPHATNSEVVPLEMPLLPAAKEVSPTPLPSSRNPVQPIIPSRPTVQKGKQPQKDATPSPSPQSSDAENAPPSSRPASTRPPLAPLSPSKNQILRIPARFGTPKAVPLSPSKVGGGLKSDVPWTIVDVETVFIIHKTYPDQENLFSHESDKAPPVGGGMTSPEKKMSVEEWIYWNAKTAEEALRQESERVVGIFEKEGARALRVLEGIEVME